MVGAGDKGLEIRPKTLFPSHHGPSIVTDQLPQGAMCYVGLAALISVRL